MVKKETYYSCECCEKLKFDNEKDARNHELHCKSTNRLDWLLGEHLWNKDKSEIILVRERREYGFAGIMVNKISCYEVPIFRTSLKDYEYVDRNEEEEIATPLINNIISNISKYGYVYRRETWK